MAGLPLPEEEEYDGFPQLDNGIGFPVLRECHLVLAQLLRRAQHLARL